MPAFGYGFQKEPKVEFDQLRMEVEAIRKAHTSKLENFGLKNVPELFLFTFFKKGI